MTFNVCNVSCYEGNIIIILILFSTYCSVEILAIIFSHLKYDNIWIRDVIGLIEKKKKHKSCLCKET